MASKYPPRPRKNTSRKSKANISDAEMREDARDGKSRSQKGKLARRIEDEGRTFYYGIQQMTGSPGNVRSPYGGAGKTFRNSDLLRQAAEEYSWEADRRKKKQRRTAANKVKRRER